MVVLDEIIVGSLVNALAMVGRQARGAGGVREDNDLATARWFETFRLTKSVPDLAGLSPTASEQLASALQTDEFQAPLQELLAVRLTDAPESDASRVRHTIRLTISMIVPDAALLAEAFADYYDDQIGALVARLEGSDSSLLPQIRSEAFSSRMINVLHAIERHTAALNARSDRSTEANFLASYRHHVIDQHGKLEPPDFERRRRVPIASIYVPTVITEEFVSGPVPKESASDILATGPLAERAIDVFALADEIDRTVLLGDPGGGKTTAANVLMHHFASETTRVPFLVTLRDFAAKDPPERSVLGHIEHDLETFYQCPAPPGLVNLLLLTSRAIVIFDGLDELLDTSRRADITTRVERFCVEYPLVPVLVTSRLVGYNEARLDDNLFSCYRLGGFENSQVGEYVCKWFAQDAAAQPGDAETFLSESESILDLRSNPLLLALLCILYRGAGSLPRKRAEVYEQCATLLFRRWDARRRIHQELRAGHLLEPALRHLAWWLFNRDKAQQVTERVLVTATTEFLHGRGFESKDEAREAAREFVKFCRGRMWVFSDAGTTATGEKLYAFTHRTFLEYFAAAQLAYDCDTPEVLAGRLLLRIARNEWWVPAELAIQIKDSTSNGGAQRIYADIFSSLSDLHVVDEVINVLKFLAQCVRSVDPSPYHIRQLTRFIVDLAFTKPARDNYGRVETPFEYLTSYCGAYRNTVADEINSEISNIFSRNTDVEDLVRSTKFACSLMHISHGSVSDIDLAFWKSYGEDLVRAHTAEIVLGAQTDFYLRNLALYNGYITVEQALLMPGGLNAFFNLPYSYFDRYAIVPYLHKAYSYLLAGWPAFATPTVSDTLEAIGAYLQRNPEVPWVNGKYGDWDYDDENSVPEATELAVLNPVTFLGAAAILSILVETKNLSILEQPRPLYPLEPLFPYLERRRTNDSHISLPELAVPDEFKGIFRNWANHQLNITGAKKT